MATAKKSNSTPKKTYPTTSGKRSPTPPSKRWSAKVTTDSTKPAPGLFKKSGKAIAEGLAKKSVSPDGPGQAVRMLNFYENRGGKNLSSERRGALETAKRLLHEKVEAKSSTKKSAKKTSAKKASAKRPAKKTAARKTAKKATR